FQNDLIVDTVPRTRLQAGHLIVKAERFRRKLKPLLNEGNHGDGGIALHSVQWVLAFVEITDHLDHQWTAFRIPVEALHTRRWIVPITPGPDRSVWADCDVLRNIAPAICSGMELVNRFNAG